MPNTRFLLTLLVVLCVAQSAYAFGAGEIPASSAVSKYAYRHGTIEQVLDKLAKVASSGGFDVGSLVKGVAGAFLSGGGVGALASSVKNSKGNTFTGLDIKRVYFGNWLRDYSQAMDVAGLSKLSDDSILILIMCLGFLSFGYATEEFEVTKERLGVYLTVEHIDNPKGYPSNAQQYDSRLRGPVNDRELEIDPNNGMKRYIASSGDMFDTSADCIRRHMRRAIEMRRSGDEHGSYRELGTALHTLEDFLAHSNYVEIALQKLGYEEVYAHVGDSVKVRAPSGESVPPIVTGTFGSLDFFSSVLGEVGDKLSSATVDDLDAKFADARKQAQNEGNSAKLRNLLSKIPSGNANDVNAQIDDVERIKQQAVNIDPTKLASKEAQKMFIDIFKTHDNIFKSIENTLEEVGLQDMIDELSNALTVFILTAIDPWISPIVKQVKDGITTGMEAIAGTEDQTIVFTDPNASDPTHSVLSKDHYDNLLNAPAGLVAVAVVTHSVTVAVDAWTNHHVDVDQAINKILEAIHHPYFARGDSAVQNDMIDIVRQWIESQSGQEKTAILRGLTKDSVKAGRNKREDAESFGTLGHRCGKGHSHGAGGAEGRPYGTHQTSYENTPAVSGYGQENVSSYGGRQSNTYGQNNDDDSYGMTNQNRPHGRVNQEQSYGGSYGQQQQQTFGGDSRRNDESSGRHGGQSQYGRHEQNTGYNNQESTYGQSENRYGQGLADENRYGTGEYGEKRFGHSDNNDAGGRYSQSDNDDRRFGSGRQEGYRGGSSAYDNESNTYGRRQDETPSYGRRDDNEDRYGQSSGRHGGEEVEQSIGRLNLRDNDEGSSRYGQGRQENQYSGRDNDSYGHHGRRNDENETREQSSYGRRHESEDQRGEYGRRNDDDDGERRHDGGRRRDDDEDGNGYGRRGY